jgi:transposase
MRRRSDARTLESSALHLLRRQVVQAVRGGMSQTDAARTFGASLRAVRTWKRPASAHAQAPGAAPG